MISFQKTQYNNRKAFSLPETAVALLIFSLVGISVFMIISSANKKGQSAYYRIIGESIGKETIELLQLLGYDEINGKHNSTIGGITIDSWSVVGNSGGIKRPDVVKSFSRKVTIENIDSSNISGIIATVYVKPGDVAVKGLGEIIKKTIIIKREK